MTVRVPAYARKQPMFWVWSSWRKLRSWVHGYQRNPDCNERRRYKDDVTFIYGEHTHVAGPPGFETVNVPFKPLKFTGPTYSVISWNWIDKDTLE